MSEVSNKTIFFYPYHIIEVIFRSLNLRFSQKKVVPWIHSYLKCSLNRIFLASRNGFFRRADDVAIVYYR